LDEMALKLYSEPDDYRLWKIQIAAEYAGTEIEIFDSKTSHDFKTITPSGKLPVLSTPRGVIFGSSAILRYIGRLHPDAGLYGDSFYESALVDQWLDFSDTDLEPVRQIWLGPVRGTLQFNGKAYSEARKELADALNVLNTHLLYHTYLVGNHVTLADVYIVSALVEPYRELFDANYRKSFENVNRWFMTLVNQKSFQKVLGKVEFAKQEKRVAKPAKPEGGAIGDGEKKPHEKSEKPQQQKQSKKEKAQENKAAKEEDLPDEDFSDPKPKGKNPLDLLPPSPMHLDTMKKLLFSQRPFYSNFFKEFWPQFDAQGYSIYFANYNYNDENKVYFMTCNLLNGFLQRCDDVRRYALGVMVLAGTNEDGPPLEVSGVWLFRGAEVPQLMHDNPDSEYYTFTKLDPQKREDREKVETYFFGEEVPSKKSGNLKVLERRFLK